MLVNQGEAPTNCLGLDQRVFPSWAAAAALHLRERRQTLGRVFLYYKSEAAQRWVWSKTRSEPTALCSYSAQKVPGSWEPRRRQAGPTPCAKTVSPREPFSSPREGSGHPGGRGSGGLCGAAFQPWQRPGAVSVREAGTPEARPLGTHPGSAEAPGPHLAPRAPPRGPTFSGACESGLAVVWRLPVL